LSPEKKTQFSSLLTGTAEFGKSQGVRGHQRQQVLFDVKQVAVNA
jgi:hypothetical protein